MRGDEKCLEFTRSCIFCEEYDACTKRGESLLLTQNVAKVKKHWKEEGCGIFKSDRRKEQKCIGVIDPEKCETCIGCDKDSPATWGEIMLLDERMDRMIELVAQPQRGAITTAIPRE